MNARVKMIAIAAVASLAGSAASADVVSGLFNTGVDASGVALVGGDGTLDPHYLVGTSDLPGVNPGDPILTYYNGAYVADDADSRWVSYSGSPFAGVGNFTAQTTFDLTGFDPLTAVITGDWGVDNEGEIFLNGVSTGITLTGIVADNFNVLHSFTISSGFVAGINTLSFAVFDGGSPAAVRLDNALLTADPLAVGVPEAATWAMMIAGFGLVGAAMRRRVALAA